MKQVLTVLAGAGAMLLAGGAAWAQSLTFYTAGPGGLAEALANGFTEKTGIAVEVYQATSGDVLARLEAERARPRADVVVLASWGEGLDLMKQGYVANYVSPQAANLRAGWTEGGLAAQGGAALAVVINTNEVESPPTSWFDLTQADWQGAVTMPDPTLSGSAAEFIAVFVQNFQDRAWQLFRDLANNGLEVPGPNAAALNPVLSGERKATLAAVDYISYGQIERGEALEVIYPEEGTVVALRPIFLQEGAPNPAEGQQFVDYMLSPEGQEKVADVFLIPSLPTVKAKRPTPGDGFTALTPDWDFVASNITDLVGRFRTEIVEGIVQNR
ncbi:MAG: extracellular solute-binding protein [Thermostichus sp. DG02_5_bins_236]